MAYREFLDEHGRMWKVWDVNPDEQVSIARTTPAESHDRLRAERSEQARSEVTPSRTRGWLAFQSDRESRRFSPIPQGWENASESQLSDYLHRASPVQNRYRV
jgi:hypothetical protein